MMISISDTEREVMEVVEALTDDWLVRFEPGTDEWAEAQVVRARLSDYRRTMYDDAEWKAEAREREQAEQDEQARIEAMSALEKAAYYAGCNTQLAQTYAAIAQAEALQQIVEALHGKDGDSLADLIDFYVTNKV